MAEEIVLLPTFPYKNVYGALGIQKSKSQIDWERCRDRFQSITDQSPVDSFLFYHRDGTGDQVINFIRTVESACECPKDMEVKFKKTSNMNVLWVGMSEWWKYRVRRSLLTALLRCGQNFTTDTGGNFVKALDSEPYTNVTREAIDAFLSGRTAVKLARHETFQGWQAFFLGKTRDQIDKCLVRLKRRKNAANEQEAK